MGLLVALQRYVAESDESRRLVWQSRLDGLAALLAPLQHASVSVREGLVPKLVLTLTKGNAMEACIALQNGRVSVQVDPSQVESGVLVINPVCLAEPDVEHLAQRLREVIG